MKNIIFLIALFSFAIAVTSCKKDPEPIDYDYHAHIHSPNTDDKHVGDTIHIHVDFESHTGEEVHHVNVRIYNKADNTEVYNMPTSAHVHAEGSHEHHDDLVLSAANGIDSHTDWILEAKVWAEEDGEGEVVESIEFHVHP